ncbi:hypothetical protein WY02_14955 [Pseudonocardia sp. AL041005-10]|nr:hypothetical protein [Pseudonocardia sp. AL041005-10]ALE79516.1 hypothetical protein WY02_14955 [Pseudonocardia sp. AL041005-10]
MLADPAGPAVDAGQRLEQARGPVGGPGDGRPDRPGRAVQRGQDRGGLGQDLAELLRRVGVDGDAPADAEPAAAAAVGSGGAEVEGADRDVQLQSGQRAHPADGAGEQPAVAVLAVGDHLAGPDLRRAGDRARRERGDEQVGVGDVVAQRRMHP